MAKAHNVAAGSVVIASTSETDWQMGTTGTLSGDWSQIEHWSSNAVPGIGDAVVIEDTSAATASWTVTETAESAASLLLDMTLGTLDAATSLTVAGTLTQAQGTLLLEPGTTASVARLVQTGGTVTLADDGGAGTHLTSTGTDELGGDVTLQNGASWTDAALIVGRPGSATVEIDRNSTLTVHGPVELDAGSLTVASGSTLSVGAPDSAGLLLLAGTGLTVDHATLISAGGAVGRDGLPNDDTLYSDATLSNGAVWRTENLSIVHILGSLVMTGTATVLLSDSTIVDAGALVMGWDADPIAGEFTAGTLALTGSSTVTAGSLEMNYASAVTLAPTASVVLGTAAAVAGALAVGAGATLDSDRGGIVGNVDDAGTLIAHDVFVTGADGLPGAVRVSGTLSGHGIVNIVGYETLEVGDATGFTGTVDFVPGPLFLGSSGTILQLDAGDLPDATIRGDGLIPFTIDVRGLAYDGGALEKRVGGTASQLVISNTTASATLNMIGSGQDLANFTLFDDDNGGTLVVDTPCYAAGTRIATEWGEVPVEALRPGDLVRTLDGRKLPVRWVGRRRIDMSRHPRPWRVAPVRVAADAIAAGVPARDLFVSADHGIFLAGRLVPAGRLANGATIARQDDWASVSYFHIELDGHRIILAENCPAETYLDTGNRPQFANAAGACPLYPDCSAAPDPAALEVWARQGAAPLLLEGEALARLRAALIARAETLGWARITLPRPALLADGMPIRLRRVGEAAWSATLPTSARQLQLRSASFIPAEVQPGSGDPRRLGLAVRDLRLDGVSLTQAAWGSGWHPAENGFAWTDGAAELRLAPCAKPTTFEINAWSSGPYWQAPPPARRARRA